jgi:hypothetical protein
VSVYGDLAPVYAPDLSVSTVPGERVRFCP